MAGEPPAYALDSFALLAYFEGEAGKARVEALLRTAEAGKCSVYLSLMNLGEVLYITEREAGLIQAQRILAAIDQLPLQIVPVTRATVLAAAHLKARFTLSYADSFAAVTAQEHGCVLLTGDPEFRPVETKGLIAVEWMPRA